MMAKDKQSLVSGENRKSRPKVSCIVPAYNEEETIGSVLRILNASSLIDEIIVVDDGSKDKTGLKVRKDFPRVRLVIHSKNKGKADALLTGAKTAKNPVLFFCDADLRGLKQKHINKLVNPVISGKTKMVVGAQEYMNVLKEKKWYRKSVGSSEMSGLVKKLGGEKVLFKKDFLKIAGIRGSNYGVEQRIVDYFERNNLPFKYCLLEGVGHVHKFQKWGLKEGFLREITALIGFYIHPVKRFLKELLVGRFNQ